MLTDFVDLKDGSKDPGIEYVKEPAIKTKKELEMKRHQENFEEFKKTELKQGNHRDAMARLKDREDCFLRVAFKEQDGLTKR